MDYYRLCGGTLFTLVVDAAQQKPTNGELYAGADNLITDENLLTNLLHIALPSLNDVSRDDAQNFKQCKVGQSRNLKMVKCEIGIALQNRMKSEYAACHREMTAFVSKFLDTSQKKDQKLVRALLELIEQDQNIISTQSFCVYPDGKTVSKADLSEMVIINIPAFLLGVLLFTLTEITDNCVGRDTYDAWCPSSGSNRTRRYYQGHMGEKITQKISFEYQLDENTGISPVQAPTDDTRFTEDSKKHPLPSAETPDEIDESERRYVDALLKVYQEKTSIPDLTLDDLNAHTKLKSHFIRQRGYYYDAELLRRGTRDIYCENADEYFNIFLEEVYGGVIEVYDQDYPSGYARLGAVLTAASHTTTQKSIISKETLWVGNFEKMGACHMLVNKQKLDGWI
ncbi:ABC-three component system protein [uncultured Ruminococcus sp.]|uniref:ABC-three component system protein n=1 Tax=uncultured Ruminococcus sp. TaxID=165186 RepID=UPI0019698B3D|nr:ABC-three component system protein [uncultured Ruminococcus sp.]